MDPTSKSAQRAFVGHLADPYQSPTVNSSELALRVALCDLVERLKRSEQTCKYLEQCRNELAKEVIKLRQENLLITRENSLSSAFIQSELLSRSKYAGGPVDLDFPNKQQQYKRISNASLGRQDDLADLTDVKQRHALNELELLRNNSSEDSYEEITARLLKQLREEMQSEASQPGASVLDGAGKSSCEASDESSKVYLPQATLGLADHHHQPTTSSKSTVLRNSGSDAYETQTTQMAISGDQALDIPSEQYASFQIQESKNQVKSVIAVGERNEATNNSSKNEQAPKDDRNVTAGISTAAHYPPPSPSSNASDDKQAANDLCAKLMSALTSDLETIGRRIQNQNEKLTKLKNKQLRKYFRRQLNDDHIVISNTKAHLEHV